MYEEQNPSGYVAKWGGGEWRGLQKCTRTRDNIFLSKQVHTHRDVQVGHDLRRHARQGDPEVVSERHWLPRAGGQKLCPSGAHNTRVIACTRSEWRSNINRSASPPLMHKTGEGSRDN